ncbi:MAG TPA: SDR family oxidoreductase [Chryseosolibacter sp.]|nr:SDR family oxidoreductase [Chryseosolibacter sp.]
MTKIALITGGSRGLGKDMALSLAAKEVDIILTYHSNLAEAQQVVDMIRKRGRKAAALRLDAGNTAGLDGFVATVLDTLEAQWKAAKVDFLINNAGIGATIPMTKMTEDVFDQFVNVHFKGAYFLTQKLLPNMNDGGSVVFVSSGTTRFTVPGYSVYAAAKGALEVLTKYVAREFGSRGIRANIVAPGPVETDFNSAAIRNNPQMKTTLASLSPLGRVGYAEDIGPVVAFLCSDEARWINGQRIEVSGGINV